MYKKSILIRLGLFVTIANPLCAYDNDLSRTISKHTNKAIHIYPNSKNVSNLGFESCNSSQNGEKLIIETFIKKNDIVFDVGAHVGDWTRFALQATNYQCYVYAFEPVPNSYKSLEKLKTQFNNKVFTFNVGIAREDRILNPEN